MNPNDFEQILTAFADTPANVDIDRGSLLIEVRDEIIGANLIQRHGELYVEESGSISPAAAWLVNRVARLPVLADRILSQIEDVAHFINPNGRLLDRIERSPDEQETEIIGVKEHILDLLGERPAQTSTGLYITSDAGEGKTTLIHHLARHQAHLYKHKETDWLIVPVSLGGRTFLRFDDVIIGALVNSLRFPFLYYEAFVRLVRMGVIVPALDGFEEMFVEGQAGDAISALGNLMDMLNGEGTVLIAARKAYFEYKSLQVQAPLFESIRGQSAEFARLHLDRWSRRQFVDYAAMRGVDSAHELFDQAARKLGANHPLLTRAVLVRRFVDMAIDGTGSQQLVTAIHNDSENYFYQFVQSIVEREAHDKWVDKSGDPARPLLSVDQHRELLGELALEMWVSESSWLKSDVVESVAAMYAESQHMHGSTTAQIIERVKQHALIVETDDRQFTYRFDHEEFYYFFLGEVLARMIRDRDLADMRRVCRISKFSDLAIDTAIGFAIRSESNFANLIDVLNVICESEPHASFVRENAAGLLVRTFDRACSTERMVVKGMSFPVDALKDRSVSNVEFVDCYFQRTELSPLKLKDCLFDHCQFAQIELDEKRKFRSCEFRDCDCYSVLTFSSESAMYAPTTIEYTLRKAGIVIPGSSSTDMSPTLDLNPQEELLLTERMCRIFYRSTGVNEGVLRQRLGSQANLFFDSVLPELIDHQVLERVQYSGAGNQSRYRLAVSLRNVQKSIKQAQGNFGKFLECIGG